MDAYRFRGIRKEYPCLFSSLIRRVTYDVEKCKRLEDVYKAEVHDGFSWRAKLPGGRTTISTKFYFYLGNTGSDVLDLVAKRIPVVLKVPVKPGLDEVSRHMISHTPFAPWCQDCVAGRSRGIPHKAIIDKARWGAR